MSFVAVSDRGPLCVKFTYCVWIIDYIVIVDLHIIVCGFFLGTPTVQKHACLGQLETLKYSLITLPMVCNPR